MKLLMLGAGAVGGYFGARLLEAGADLAFLVRPARAERLRADGLRVLSPYGNAHLRTPPLCIAGGNADAAFDAVVLTAKAYDLPAAIAAVAPWLKPDAVVLPLLNGLLHLDALDAAFGRRRVLGGLARIGATLGAAGEVIHLNRVHALTLGVRDDAQSAAAATLAAVFSAARFDSERSGTILQDMWEKFVFLGTLAGITSLLRSDVGTIQRTRDGTRLTLTLLDECRAVAAAAGHPPRADKFDDIRAKLTARDSRDRSSMLMDIERGSRIEAAHLIGDLIARAAAADLAAPLLATVWCHLQAYEASLTPPGYRVSARPGPDKSDPGFAA